jgi:hypothetical protein
LSESFLKPRILFQVERFKRRKADGIAGLKAERKAALDRAKSKMDEIKAHEEQVQELKNGAEEEREEAEQIKRKIERKAAKFCEALSRC